LEEANHLDGWSGSTSNGDGRESIGGKDLLNGTVRDDVAFRRSPVTGHHNAACVAQRSDSRSVSDLGGALRPGDLNWTLDASKKVREIWSRIFASGK